MQLFDQILNRKASCPCASYTISHDLRQLPLAFRFSTPQLLCADKGAGPLVGLQQSPEFEFAISPNNGVGIDGQVDRELTHGGQLVADGKDPGSNATTRLIYDLAINWHPAVEVKTKPELRPSGIHYSLNVLVY